MQQLYLCSFILKYTLNFFTFTDKSCQCQVLRRQTPNCNPQMHRNLKPLTLQKTEIADKCGAVN
jgi:hypothetical protein